MNATLSEISNSTGKQVKPWRDKFFESISSIKDIEWFFGLLVVLFSCYLVVFLLHIVMYKWGKKDRRVAPLSPLLAKLYQVKEKVHMILQLLVACYAGSNFFHFTWTTYAVLFTISGLICVVWMFIEMYVILISIFCITKYYNHTYSGSVELTTDFWKAAIRLTCWFVTMKNLVFLLWGTYDSQDELTKILSYFFGLYLSTQLLLALSALSFFPICFARRQEIAPAERILCIQNMLLTALKIVLIFLLIFINYCGVEDGILCAFFLVSDILLLPIVVKISEIISICIKQEHATVDLHMEEI
uniref:Transmembrane protein n=1 Tax=Caenorhabditis tropicalis TaxID=1561998 RepID=A0A1I7V2C9_9PELO